MVAPETNTGKFLREAAQKEVANTSIPFEETNFYEQVQKEMADDSFQKDIDRASSHLKKHQENYNKTQKAIETQLKKFAAQTTNPERAEQAKEALKKLGHMDDFVQTIKNFNVKEQRLQERNNIKQKWQDEYQKHNETKLQKIPLMTTDAFKNTHLGSTLGFGERTPILLTDKGRIFNTHALRTLEDTEKLQNIIDKRSNNTQKFNSIEDYLYHPADRIQTTHKPLFDKNQPGINSLIKDMKQEYQIPLDEKEKAEFKKPLPSHTERPKHASVKEPISNTVQPDSEINKKDVIRMNLETFIRDRANTLDGITKSGKYKEGTQKLKELNLKFDQDNDVKMLADVQKLDHLYHQLSTHVDDPDKLKKIIENKYFQGLADHNLKDQIEQFAELSNQKEQTKTVIEKKVKKDRSIAEIERKLLSKTKTYLEKLEKNPKENDAEIKKIRKLIQKTDWSELMDPLNASEVKPEKQQVKLEKQRSKQKS